MACLQTNPEREKALIKFTITQYGLKCKMKRLPPNLEYLGSMSSDSENESVPKQATLEYSRKYSRSTSRNGSDSEFENELLITKQHVLTPPRKYIMHVNVHIH